MTVSLNQIKSEIIKENSGFSKQEVNIIVDSFLTKMAGHLSDVETIKLPKFGNFTPRVVAEKGGVCLNTGERIIIPGYIQLSFRASSFLKDKINGR